jgi:hypothetical protein
MPSTFDPLLRLELQATGENATTWGIKTNTNLDLLASSIAGAITLDVAGSGDYTLSTANGAVDESRQAILVLTGLLTGNRTIIVPSSPKNYTVINNTTGAFTVTLRQSAGTGLAIPTVSPILTVCTSTTCVDAVGATPFTRTLLDDADATTARTTLGLGSASTLNATATGSGLVTAADAAAARTTIAVPIEVIRRQTVSVAVGAVDFVLPAGYASYDLYFYGVRLGFDGVSLGVRVSTDGGSTYRNDAAYAWAATYNDATAVAVGNSVAGETMGLISPSADNGFANVTINGDYRVFVGSATLSPMLHGNAAAFDNSASRWVRWSGMVTYGAGVGAINAVRFLAIGGSNIDAGTFELRGVRA